ncbi:aromatic ring-hydroxylating oxygenase subunit alpha [Cytophaga aurantiaca]|uniref:aromatic ring-hydroxylating oxygenase subunit alpha n=1 Tax=Cytophaga aurantiaca TaxID=29530 RepID=UPI000360E356|nr:aromatic ring-hydroxylating dioxygenase subunit alpha [Cytophaga aurantiaca]
MNSNPYFIPVLFEKQLTADSPVKVWLIDTPVVLVKSKDAIHAYEDFCPHRGAPLSKGFVKDGVLTCRYHGWEFNANGKNKHVPVKNAAVDCELKRIQVAVKYGIIWISKDSTALIPELSEELPAFTLNGKIHASILNTLENFLEGSHTHFVHDGLVRSKKITRQKIEATLIPSETGFSVHYQSEPPKGLLTVLTPARFRNLRAVSTYMHPNISVLEYWNDANIRVARIEGILSTQQTQTVYLARIYLHLGLFTPIATMIAKPIFKKIIQQDKVILELQEKNLQHFKQPSFVSDETDVVGVEIQRWLYNKENRAVEPFNFTVYW